MEHIRPTAMLTFEQVKADLGVSTKQLNIFINTGILNPIFLGKGWKFSQEELLEFQREYRGEYLSNYVEAVTALEKHKKGTTPTVPNKN